MASGKTIGPFFGNYGVMSLEWRGVGPCRKLWSLARLICIAIGGTIFGTFQNFQIPKMTSFWSFLAFFHLFGQLLRSFGLISCDWRGVGPCRKLWWMACLNRFNIHCGDFPVVFHYFLRCFKNIGFLSHLWHIYTPQKAFEVFCGHISGLAGRWPLP